MEGQGSEIKHTSKGTVILSRDLEVQSPVSLRRELIYLSGTLPTAPRKHPGSLALVTRGLCSGVGWGHWDVATQKKPFS